MLALYYAKSLASGMATDGDRWDQRHPRGAQKLPLRGISVLGELGARNDFLWNVIVALSTGDGLVFEDWDNTV